MKNIKIVLRQYCGSYKEVIKKIGKKLVFFVDIL